jgi:hypothetical protein
MCNPNEKPVTYERHFHSVKPFAPFHDAVGPSKVIVEIEKLVIVVLWQLFSSFLLNKGVLTSTQFNVVKGIGNSEKMDSSGQAKLFSAGL